MKKSQCLLFEAWPPGGAVSPRTQSAKLFNQLTCSLIENTTITSGKPQITSLPLDHVSMYSRAHTTVPETIIIIIIINHNSVESSTRLDEGLLFIYYRLCSKRVDNISQAS